MPRKSAKPVIVDAVALTVPEAAAAAITPPSPRKPRAAAKPRAAKAEPAAKKKVTTAPLAAEPSQDQVAEEAYLLWLSEGQPQGRDVEHWLVAEQIVRSRLSLLSAAVHTA
ncbi:DUF2934 domain-containing protein [Niveispirillum fermenti]|uniref:DUF2934 domain-containing protein n=1 Tax=Niveispirillum fermenti TaxID=1233113 RepID=UPI003A8373AD